MNAIINGQNSTTNLIYDTAMTEITTSVSDELDLSKAYVKLTIEALLTGDVDSLQLLGFDETTNTNTSNNFSHTTSTSSKKPCGKVESLRTLTASASESNGVDQSHWFGFNYNKHR